MRLSCFGKVFIVGEYTCIEGGPCIVAPVEPQFGLDSVQSDDRNSPLDFPFAAQSPAGRYLTKVSHEASGLKLAWHDPFQSPVGIGSSSAQFVLSVEAVSRFLGRDLPKSCDVLDLYWNTVGESQGVRPSGADVVMQWIGRPISFRNNPFEVSELPPWNNDEASFILVYTGSKAKTHEHLMALKARGFPVVFKDTLACLDSIVLRAERAWREARAEELGQCLTQYQMELARGGLAQSDFTSRIEKTASWSGVLGCKGSGAQGGDCVLCLVKNDSLDDVRKKFTSLGWKPVNVQFKTDSPAQRKH